MVPDTNIVGTVEPERVGVLDAALARVEEGLALIASLFIFMLMMVGVAQVVARAIWDIPIVGYIDIVEQMMAIAAFVAIGYADRLGAHIRMDFLPQTLRGRSQIALELLVTAIALVTITFLTYATWFSFMRAFQLGDSTMDIQLPVWPGKLVLVISLALLLLRLVLSVIGYSRALARPPA